MLIDESKIEEMLKTAMIEGPTFGQSRLQWSAFNVNKHESLGRSYRQVLLEINQKLSALKLCRITRKKLDAEIAVLQNSLRWTVFKHKRTIIKCDIESKQLSLEGQEKMIVDCINELNYLWSEFEKMPKISREEFEAQEFEYWKKRFITDAQLQLAARGTVDEGTARSLLDIGLNPVQVILELKQANKAIEHQVLTSQLESLKNESQKLEQNKNSNKGLIKE